jgi:predicted CoA-binding protein
MNDDVAIRQVLGDSKLIAVVGLSRDPTKTSRSVTAYMMSKGYRIVPVNPLAESLMGEKVYPSLADLPQGLAETVDIVDIFRPSEDLPPIVEDALESLPNLKMIWAQLGIHNAEAAKAAEGAGIPMVQNRCIRVEHARLL